MSVAVSRSTASDAEFRGWIPVVDQISEREIREAVRRSAFAELLSLPVGERLGRAEPTRRRLSFATSLRVSPE
jgi:hypothetical protein